MADYTVQNEPEQVDITIDKIENLEQTMGQATDKIMSQKAVTDYTDNSIQTAILDSWAGGY